MLNKRAVTLLALVLAGSMVLSGPSAALASASSGDSKKTSQTEMKKKDSESEDSVKDKKDSKKKKKQVSGNSVSSVSGGLAEERDKGGLSKASESGNSLSDDSQGDADTTTTPTPTPTSTPTDTPTDMPLPTSVNTPPSVSGQQAREDDNKIYLIQPQPGNFFLSGTEVAFYATGAGYGPEEPQESNPVDGATRYKPVSWSVGTVSGSWTGYTDKTEATVVSGDRVPGEYRFGDSFVLNTDQTEPVPYTLQVDYQKEIYKDGKWEKDDSKVSQSIGLYVMYVPPTSTDTPSGVPTGSPTPTATPTPFPSSTDIPSSQQAMETNNGIHWINPGSTYRAGATLQFYATGDGYGPEAAQELNPVKGATRYVPVSWSVTTTTSGVTGTTSGTWQKYNEATRGSTSGNVYTPGEYRFKGAFTLSTNLTSTIPCTLQVNYRKETYGGKRWDKDSVASVSKSVSFYIRNTSLTLTPTVTPTRSLYATSIPTTAATSGISSNAKNASTDDNTPIGALALLMMAAAGSGVTIFRRKQNRS